MSPSSSLARAWSLGAAVAFCLANIATAGASEPPANKPPATDGAAAAVSSGSSSIPLNSGESSHGLEADESRVTTEILRDGTGLARLNGQEMQAVVAHIGADGRIEYTCTDQSVERAVKSATETNTHEQ